MKIDGTDVRDATFESLAATVGVVSQETYLFHASIRDNLRFARPEATDAQIEDAARAAQIHDLIASLPAGYDTEVGERGYRFSGGEKQRIAIARTMLRNPPVLVLDEATSALDTETERQVQLALDRAVGGPHDDRDRAPALHDQGRRPDRGARPRPRSWSAARTRSCSTSAAATPSSWRATRSSSPSARRPLRRPARRHGMLPAVRKRCSASCSCSLAAAPAAASPIPESDTSAQVFFGAPAGAGPDLRHPGGAAQPVHGAERALEPALGRVADGHEPAARAARPRHDARVRLAHRRLRLGDVRQQGPDRDRLRRRPGTERRTAPGCTCSTPRRSTRSPSTTCRRASRGPTRRRASSPTSPAAATSSSTTRIAPWCRPPPATCSWSPRRSTSRASRSSTTTT